MTEPKDLCGRCAAMLQEGYDLKRVGGGVDHKVTCSHCGRRRYGGHLHDRKAQQKQSISIPERPWAYGLGSLIFFVRPRKWSPPLQGERERKGGMGGW